MIRKERGIKHEVFRTPLWVFNLLYDKYPNHFKGRILDFSAGSGHIISDIINRGNAKQHCLIDIRREEKKVWKKNKRLKNA